MTRDPWTTSKQSPRNRHGVRSLTLRTGWSPSLRNTGTSDSERRSSTATTDRSPTPSRQRRTQSIRQPRAAPRSRPLCRGRACSSQRRQLKEPLSPPRSGRRRKGLRATSETCTSSLGTFDDWILRGELRHYFGTSLRCYALTALSWLFCSSFHDLCQGRRCSDSRRGRQPICHLLHRQGACHRPGRRAVCRTRFRRR